MQTIIDNDEIQDFSLENLVGEFQIDVSYLCPGEIEQAEYELFANQYAYIKFGLILEKFRNQSWWKRCHEKFTDFKDFCKRKVNLSRWQVVNAIKSANVAIRLVFLGFSDLPRNASQALAMADLSLERLGEVWGNITHNLAHHQITTDKIKREINPDAVPVASTIRIPTALLGRLREQAQNVGLTMNQYLEQLADGQSPDGSRPVETESLTDEEIACIDRLELEWKSGDLKPPSNEPKSETVLARFDRTLGAESDAGEVIMITPPS
jgi:hypothetical protein